MDFVLWSTVNNKVYLKKPTDSDGLWEHNEEAFHNLDKTRTEKLSVMSKKDSSCVQTPKLAV
jgi:hypothetical protein